ncbi:phosphonate C-P lyase system protein PhnH [Streptomyces sp. NPDC004752]
MSMSTASDARVPLAPRQSPLQAWSGRAFRVLLATLSQPGHMEQLPAPGFLRTPVPPACRLPLALASRGTAIALPGLMTPASQEIADLTGARITDPARAELVAYTRPLEGGELLELARGSAAAPEQGASAAIGVTAIHPTPPDAGAVRLCISGPGVAGRRTVAVDAGASGLQTILRDRQESCSHPPTGIDLWLFDGDGQVLGLPRSSTITWQEY